MGVTRKIKKALSYILRYDMSKSLYWRLKLRLPQSFSLHVCPCSIVSIDKSAKVEVGQGELVINESWFETKRRRYVSEFRLDKDSTFVCEGDFKLFQGASIYVAPSAKLVLHGGWSFLNTNSTLNCFHYIEIGKGCAISDNVCIADSDSHCIDGQKEKATAPIIIGDHVWIGKNVIVLKGITIGAGAVVGAGSVVTKDVPCNTMVAGNPARPIRTIESWE